MSVLGKGALELPGVPNGLTQDHDFDSSGRVSAITYNDGSTTLGSLNYGYDKASRRTDVTGSCARALLPDALSSATYTTPTTVDRVG